LKSERQVLEKVDERFEVEEKPSGTTNDDSLW